MCKTIKKLPKNSEEEKVVGPGLNCSNFSKFCPNINFFIRVPFTDLKSDYSLDDIGNLYPTARKVSLKMVAPNK